MSDDFAEDLEEATVREKLAEDLDNNFHLLIIKYEKIIFAIALSRLDNFQDAEDITAETFAKVYRSLSKKTPYKMRKINLQRWLLQSIKNNCNSHKRFWRRLKRQPSSISLDQQDVRESIEGMPHGQYTSAEDTVVQRENNNELCRLLRQHLTEYQCTILILKYCGGMPDIEIAKTLNRTPPAIKKARERAVQILRERLPKDDVNGKSGDKWPEQLTMSIS
jgi:RNA polymerase sigma factor (sigma-70 family)